MKTPYRQLLIPVLVSALIGASTAQSLPQVHLLPQNRAVELGGQLSRGQILRALRTALNSPGDSIVLNLRAEANIALVSYINAGADRSLEAQVRRTAAGFELWVSASEASSMGISPYRGLGIRATDGQTKRVIFTFPNLDRTALGLQQMAFLRNVRVDLLEAARRTQAAAVGIARRALRDAGLIVDAARRFETHTYNFYRALRAGLRDVGRAFRSAGRALSKARKKLRDARKKADKAGPLAGLVKKALKAAEKLFSKTSKAYRRARSVYRSTSRAFAAADRSLREARADVRRATDSRNWRQTALRGAEQALSTLNGALTVIFDTLTTAQTSLAAVQFELRRGGDVAAAMAIPGVNLQNLGAGVAAASFAGATIRYDLPNKTTDAKLTLTVFRTVNLSAHGAGPILLGGRGEIAGKLAVRAVFEKPRKRFFRFNIHESETFFLLDMSVLAVAGVGATLESGVGRRIRVAVDAATWMRIARSAPQLTRAPTLRDLSIFLRSFQADVTVQDRWINGARASFGFSVAGYGLNLSGAATWNDAGGIWQQRISAGDAIGLVSNPTWLSDTAARLRLLL